MIKQKNKIQKSIVLSLALATSIITILLVMQNVAAAGITSPYWNGFPLKLLPGESKDIQFGLQNLVGEDNITFRANLITGNDVAQITDKNATYLVPAVSKNNYLDLHITIPQSAKIGDKYRVGLSFTTITSGTGGQLNFGTAYDTYFDVLVQNTSQNTQNSTANTSSNTLYISIGAVIVLLVILAVVRRKRKE